jgi:hypothetical protein
MPNLFRKASGYRWAPDADATNAPEGSLLRADNTVPSETGARAVRKGSAIIYSGLQDQRVHSLYAPTLQDTVYRIAGVDDQVYRDGVTFGTEFDGSGDIAFGDDSYQLFAARGKTKKKFDGTHFHEWGIAAPQYPATLTAVAAITTTVASFDSTEDPAFTINEGTGAFVDSYAAVANGALSLTPSATTGRATASKKFTSDQDYLDISGSSGGSTDLFDFRAWMQEPQKVNKITVMFGLGTGADPFVDDYYYFDWNIKENGTVDIKDVASISAAAVNIANTKMLSVLSPSEVTSIKSPAEAAAVMKRIGRSSGPSSTQRVDAQENSPAWGHLAATRGQFIRVGGTAGRDWKTVRGFKVVYTGVPKATEKAYFDDAIWSGGGDRALTGTYRVGYCFARQFKDAQTNEIYTELSPMSPISSDVVLNQQTLKITIGATALSAKDPQVDQTWIYIHGGFLDTYYRFLVTSATVNLGMTIDELTNPAGSNFNSPEERSRLASHGFTYAPGYGAQSSDLIVTVDKSETDALIENETYTPGMVGPPDNIIAIAGPWNSRMFVLTEDGYLYASSQRAPSSFSLYHCVDIRRYGIPYWMLGVGGNIYVGCSEDILRISGTGDEEAGTVFADIYAEPTNNANPPVDGAVQTDGNAIIYRAADGLMSFTGASSTPMPESGTGLLWRGYSRHGVEHLNTTTGRFRMALDNHDVYMLATEGTDTDPTSLWRYDAVYQQWNRFTYPVTFLSLWREPDGSLLAGTTTGEIYELEVGNSDNGTAIPVNIITPIDDGDATFSRKDSSDIQLHCYTAGVSGTIGLLKDGGSVSALDIPFTATTPGVFRADATALGAFLRMQLRISGSFNEFLLHSFNVTYRQRPQQVMVLDTGHLIPPNNGDLAWVVESEIDCISPVDLTLTVYKDDVLHASIPVVVKPNVRSVYRSIMPRGTKARRLRLVFTTTNADGDSNPGFEPYFVRVRHAGSGNMTELPIGQGDRGNV